MLEEEPIQAGIKKILVPIDFSNYCISACRYAAHIAKSTHAEIILFHAYYSPAFDLIEMSGNKSTRKKLREDVAKELLQTTKEEFNAFFNRILEFPEFSQLKKESYKSELRLGLAKEQIFTFAEVYQPDLIVMGTRGKGKKNSSFFGSLTELVIKKMKFPILAIPEEYTFSELINTHKIVYLTDFDEYDFCSIQKLLKLTESHGSEIHCLHVNPSSNQREKLRMEGLKEYFYKVYDETVVECIILDKETDLINELNQYIIEKQINLISLTTRKRRIIDKLFKPNLTKKLFYHTSIPLLVFHS